MMWDIIRDFIVRYITGGVTSNGESYLCSIGNIYYYLDNEIEESAIEGTTSNLFNIGLTGSGQSMYIGLGDWLATTLTVVIMIIGVVLLCLLVRWVFKTVVNAFAFRR